MFYTSKILTSKLNEKKKHEKDKIKNKSSPKKMKDPVTGCQPYRYDLVQFRAAYKP